uniref:Uncharacterized protein n=1 Tax=Glossina pallidipes TaxID=7398 RepID=A0A1B0A408_GLOPL
MTAMRPNLGNQLVATLGSIAEAAGKDRKANTSRANCDRVLTPNEEAGVIQQTVYQVPKGVGFLWCSFAQGAHKVTMQEHACYSKDPVPKLTDYYVLQDWLLAATPMHWYLELSPQVWWQHPIYL